MSKYQRPELPRESARIEAAGGFVQVDFERVAVCPCNEDSFLPARARGWLNFEGITLNFPSVALGVERLIFATQGSHCAKGV